MMKEFIYENKRRKPILVCDGEYKGIYYAITSLGTYPCSYVKIPKEYKEYKKDFENIDDSIHCCNGGLTYSEFGIPTGDCLNDFFIGWDYGHCWDYTPELKISGMLICPEIDGLKWTTEKIYKEIKSVIDALIKNNKEK